MLAIIVLLHLQAGIECLLNDRSAYGECLQFFKQIVKKHKSPIVCNGSNPNIISLSLYVSCLFVFQKTQIVLFVTLIYF